MAIAIAIAIGGWIYVSKRVRLAVAGIEMRCGLSRGSCLTVVVVLVEDSFEVTRSRLLTLLLPILYVCIRRRKSKEEVGKKGKVLYRQEKDRSEGS
jgi:hypothetical protein